MTLPSFILSTLLIFVGIHWHTHLMETLWTLAYQGQWRPSLGRTHWSTLWQAHNNVLAGCICPLTCSKWPIPWWLTHRSSLPWYKHSNSLRRPHRLFVCSVLGLRIWDLGLDIAFIRDGTKLATWVRPHIADPIRTHDLTAKCRNATDGYEPVLQDIRDGWMISQDDKSLFWVPFEPASCRNDLGAANDGGPL